MGRITLGDIAIGGLLTLVLMFMVGLITSFVAFVILGQSDDQFFTILMITVYSIFVVGGTLMWIADWRAGYPVLTSWAWGAAGILAFSFILVGIGTLVLGGTLSIDLQWVIAFDLSLLLLGLFFVVGLAGFLNARSVGGATNKTYGTRPGTWGISIYKSNQPDIYEGIKSLDFDDKAPGSLYRGRQ